MLRNPSAEALLSCPLLFHKNQPNSNANFLKLKSILISNDFSISLKYLDMEIYQEIVSGILRVKIIPHGKSMKYCTLNIEKKTDIERKLFIYLFMHLKIHIKTRRLSALKNFYSMIREGNVSGKNL